MRLLADENFPRSIVETLRSQGHDILWARIDCSGLADRALLELAEGDDRLILTLDKDFWQIGLQRPVALRRCGVILFRVFPSIPENLEPLVGSTLRARHPWIGNVSVVTRDGIEMFPTGARIG